MKGSARTAAALAAAVMLASGMSVTAFADKIKTEDGVAYRYTDDGKNHGTYTGWAKNKNGRLYYKYGRTLYGWQRIDGKLYHFNEKGYADTGKTEIAGCTYYFGEKGEWTGKRSKKGARPADFNVKFSGYLRDYETKTGVLRLMYKYDENYDPVYAYATIKLSEKELQVLWSSICETDLLEADTSINYNDEYVLEMAKKFPEKYPDVWWSEPSVSYTYTITANGKDYTFKFSDEIRQFNNTEKTAAGLN